MKDIQLNINPDNKGSFFIEEDGERVAEMVFGIEGTNMIVFHTEVSPKLKGQGIANQLMDKMTAYVREHSLKVVPLCPFVSAQFRRHPELYTDVWNQHWHG